ncbi:MAG: tetratricopeptide repeat protein [Planctomycetes bacterium]|nr:tetratricopeptide repeat protein [Planctomycetota bacterium]
MPPPPPLTHAAAASLLALLAGCAAPGGPLRLHGALPAAPGRLFVAGVAMEAARPGVDDCAPAALTAVLGHHGVRLAPGALESPSGAGSGQEVSLPALALRARAHGVDVRVVEGNRALVHGELGRSRPVVVALAPPGGGRHAVVVVGADADPEGPLYVLERDGGTWWWAGDAFERAWAAAGHPALLVGPVAASTASALPGPPATAGAASLARGLVLESQGDREAALASFREAVDLDPRCREAWLGLARLHREARSTDEAIAAYDRAVDLDPADPVAANNLAWLLAEEGRDPARAVALAQGALEGAGPGQRPAVLETLAVALLGAGDVEGARATLRRALEEARAAGDGGAVERLRARVEGIEDPWH